jgi:type I restriction-modification system DNA methylase subunit
MKFDIVVANPPFSLTSGGAGPRRISSTGFTGAPPKSKGHHAFISHMIERGSRRGWLAIAPHGVCSDGG